MGPYKRIKPHPTRWHYPLITYLILETWNWNSHQNQGFQRSDLTSVEGEILCCVYFQCKAGCATDWITSSVAFKFSIFHVNTTEATETFNTSFDWSVQAKFVTSKAGRTTRKDILKRHSQVFLAIRWPDFNIFIILKQITQASIPSPLFISK